MDCAAAPIALSRQTCWVNLRLLVGCFHTAGSDYKSENVSDEFANHDFKNTMASLHFGYPATGLVAMKVATAQSFALKLTNSENLVSGDNLDLCDSVAIPQDNTNLRWSGTFTGELGDLINNLVGGGLQPCWSSAGVWNGRGRNALAVAVHATHSGGGLRSAWRCKWCSGSWVSLARSLKICNGNRESGAE